MSLSSYAKTRRRVAGALVAAFALVTGLLVTTTGAPGSAAAAGSGGVDISAGGPAAAPFAADEDFSGGATASVTNAISTTGLTNPAPQSVYQHNRYGNFTYTIGGFTAGASYTVRLHFAEEYWTTAGSRLFNVLIDGTQVLTSFDIFATAGGEFKAVIEQFTAVAPATGTITIQFVTVKDNAQVNGIEIDPGGSGTGSGSGAVDISAGGPAAAPFAADEDFSGGATASVTNAISTTGLTNPAPQSVYQHNRYGNFTYTIGGFTAGASYTVRLHFAEEYWTTAGSRLFNVLIDGTQVLTSFDIFATAGGEFKAVIEQFTAVAPATGTITIGFVTVKDNAQVNGIEIDPGGSTGNTVTVTSPGNQTSTTGTAASLQIAATDSASGQTLAYTATGLPAGLSINSATGLISGTPTTAGTSTVTVTATDTTGASGTATFTWTVNASGSGEPPASFWGNTSAIPAATNVLEVSVVNQTNGQYPDSEVYWSFNGQTESIAQQPYIDMPANSAGRMYFYLGTPNGPYFDFIEFTVGTSSINVDTTRVDRFGLKLAILLHGHDGSNQEVGEDYATFQESRAATFQRFENFVPAQFKELATDDAPYGIPSPGNDPAFQAGGADANYFSAYAAANGDTTDSTAQIFGCGGTLANNPTLCAGLNRHVAQLPAAEQSDPANFYQAAPANYYAEFWHENAINGKQYGFPYDDDAGQSSDISVANPQYMVVAVGW